MLTRQVIRKAVEAALEEDAPNGDIVSNRSHRHALPDTRHSQTT